MGLFSSTKRRYVDPLHPEFRGLREPLAEYLKEAPGRTEKLVGQYKRQFAPLRQQWSQMLTGGPEATLSEYEKSGLGFAGRLLDTEALQKGFMGGYSSPEQRAALRGAFEKEAPEQLRRMLTSAGLSAPGIGHGRVREEVARRGTDLLTNLQTALAQENLASSQLRGEALGQALGAGQWGAGYMGQVGSLGEMLRRQAGLQSGLEHMFMQPEAIRQMGYQPLLALSQMLMQPVQKIKTQEPGLLGKVGQAVGGIAGMIPGIGQIASPLIGGFSSLLGGGGQQSPYMDPNYLQWMNR